MSRLFKRSVAVSVWRMSTPTPTAYNPHPLGIGEQLDITGLRVRFKVTRDFTKHPNSADVEIFNLAPSTRADLQERPLKVQLLAGYDGQNRLLTTGDVLFSMSKQDGPNWNTLLQLADGGRQYANARINKSFAPGTTYRTVLGDIAASMGLTLPAALDKNTALARKFEAGSVNSGPSRDELTRLLNPFGLQWSIQDGSLRVLSDAGTISQGALPLGEEQGMIGTPEFGSPAKSGKPPHMTVRCLLYPELVPGDLIQLSSRAKSGLFKLVKVTHSGDTHAADWQTEVEIQPAR